MDLNNYLTEGSYSNYEQFRDAIEINVPENFNFAYDVVDDYAENNPDKVALVWTNDEDTHREVTFAELKRESDKVAAYMTNKGITAGDKVMLILKRRVEFWFTIIGLHKIGAVTIPATHLLTEKDIIYRCNAATIKMIVSVTDDQVIDSINRADKSCESLEYIAGVGEDIPNNWDDFRASTQGSDLEFKTPETRPTCNEDISLIYFTSGTTAHPKMVAHDFTYPLGHIITAKYWQNLKEDDLHLTVSDTGWAKAVWGKIYGQWLAGAKVFVYDFEKFIPEKMLEKLEKFKVSTFCAPPTVYNFLSREDMGKYDLSSLRWASVAGEPVNTKVFNRFYELTGLKLHEGFGQTETTLSIGTFPFMTPVPGSMGKPSPEYDIQLINSDGEICGDNETGEIVINTAKKRPMGLFMGYYRDEEKTNETYNNNIYHTGDLASRDSDGYFWFVGRVDDVIKSSGYRIGPFEVEDALMTHEAVVECAVTGSPDEVRGQIVKASIILADSYKPGSEQLIKELQDHVKKATAPYKYPRIIQFIDSLPKTISGKVRRVELRD